MADRTSAGLFGMIFEMLAEGKLLQPKTVWAMTRDYDFSPYQMGCDESLKKLGLLWICPCEEDEDRGGHGTYNYGPDITECRQCGKPRAPSREAPSTGEF